MWGNTPWKRFFTADGNRGPRSPGKTGQRSQGPGRDLDGTELNRGSKKILEEDLALASETKTK